MKKGRTVLRIAEDSGTTFATACVDRSEYLGSTRVCTDGSGDNGPSGTWTCHYEPFGEFRAGTTCSVPTSFRFAGMQWDEDTGLYHTWFREYDATQGRWTGVDPLSGDPSNPQSLNRYVYVLNDPANLVDPLGLYPCPLLDNGDPDMSFAGCDPWGNFSLKDIGGGLCIIPGDDECRGYTEQKHARGVFEAWLEARIRERGWDRDPDHYKEQINAFLLLYGYTLKTNVAGEFEIKSISMTVFESSTLEAFGNNLGEISSRTLGGWLAGLRLTTIRSAAPTRGPLFPTRTIAPAPVLQFPTSVHFTRPQVYLSTFFPTLFKP